MAYVHRLIFCVLVALSAWVPGSSYATTTTTTSTDVPALQRPGWVDFTGADKNYPTAEGACQSYAVQDPAAVFGLGAYLQNDGNGQRIWCDETKTYDSGYVYFGHVAQVWTQTSSPQWYCEFPDTYVLVGLVCKLKVVPTSPKDACDAVSAMANGGFVQSGANVSVHTCYQGQDVRGSFAAIGGGSNQIQGPFSCDGTPCTVGSGAGASAPSAVPTAASATTAAGCAASGGSWGAVNGVNVCVASPAATNPSTPVAGEAGSSSSSTNADGSVSKMDASTVCDGVNCTTTNKNTVTPVGGGPPVVSTTSKTEPQKSFCTDNPLSPICKVSAFGAGSCGSVPSCDGDAIQCAIAAASFKSSCAYDNSAAATTEEGRYNAAKVLTGDQSVDAANPLGFAVTPGSFDRTNLLGAEVGLSDLSVTVMGRTTTLPFSGLNTWFAVLGNILMGCTALLCMRIVARG